MKIVNRDDFLKLPSGIVYSDYQSHGMINNLYVKLESLKNDWFYQDLINSLDAMDSREIDEIIDSAENAGTSFDMNLDISERDGLFKVDQHFVVYEKSDVLRLLEKIEYAAIGYPDI